MDVLSDIFSLWSFSICCCPPGSLGEDKFQGRTSTYYQIASYQHQDPARVYHLAREALLSGGTLKLFEENTPKLPGFSRFFLFPHGHHFQGKKGGTIIKLKHFHAKNRFPVFFVFENSLLVGWFFDVTVLVAVLGPIPAYLYADSGFMAYSGGVYTHTCDHWANHAITVVGFGPDYWNCLNSWGTYWGVQGTFKVGLCVLTDFQSLG